MTPGTFEISVAVAMIAAVALLALWIQRTEAAGSWRRMGRMMTTLGLAEGITALGAPPATVRQARHRCRRCPLEAYCERWLAGEEAGDNAFCPNARTFRDYAEAA